MTRRFWAGVMILALLLTAGSASILFDHLSSVEEAKPAPLRNVPALEATPTPAVEASTAAVTASSAPAVAASVTEHKPEVAATDKAKRNISFKLVRPTAKQVDIIGDFNSWTRKPMKKKGKSWETSVSLAPGTYEYAFVVDGKRVRDPNNKQSGSNGKSSVLTVTPLAKRP